MSEPIENNKPTMITGKSARNTAAMMDWGNIVAILIPPLIILWFGASMLVYALNRHHPNPKVGHYIQWAAYRFYGITGFFIGVAIFFPASGWTHYIISWLMAVVVIVPWSIWDLINIYKKEEWVDVPIEDEHH